MKESKLFGDAMETKNTSSVIPQVDLERVQRKQPSPYLGKEERIMIQ